MGSFETQARICPICIDDHSENRECYKKDLIERIQTLEEQSYVPGVFECPKCKCLLQANYLYVKSGTIGANSKPQFCPNECGPMWRMKWKDYSSHLIESCERLQEENIKLREGKPK